MKNSIQFLIAIASLFSAAEAHASIIGLFFHQAGDQVEVSLKNGHPVLKVTDVSYPDIAECAGGYQVFRHQKPLPSQTLEITEDKILSFPLYLNREVCLEAVWKKNNTATRVLTQEIDLYDVLGMYQNGADVIRDFENGKLKLGFAAQANYDGFETSTFERAFTLDEATSGKVLLRADEKVFGR